MSEQEDTLRSPEKYYHENETKHIKEHGGDEVAPEPQGQDARKDPGKQQENRDNMGTWV